MSHGTKNPPLVFRGGGWNTVDPVWFRLVLESIGPNKATGFRCFLRVRGIL